MFDLFCDAASINFMYVSDKEFHKNIFRHKENLDFVAVYVLSKIFLLYLFCYIYCYIDNGYKCEKNCSVRNYKEPFYRDYLIVLILIIDYI